MTKRKKIPLGAFKKQKRWVPIPFQYKKALLVVQYSSIRGINYKSIFQIFLAWCDI